MGKDRESKKEVVAVTKELVEKGPLFDPGAGRKRDPRCRDAKGDDVWTYKVCSVQAAAPVSAPLGTARHAALQSLEDSLSWKQSGPQGTTAPPQAWQGK